MIDGHSGDAKRSGNVSLWLAICDADPNLSNRRSRESVIPMALTVGVTTTALTISDIF
jgi:hypothetical protein